MGLLELLKLYVGLAMVVFSLVESSVYVRLDQAPPPRTRLTTAIFKYSFVDQSGQFLCGSLGCSVYCELDQKPLKSCSNGLMIFKNLTVNHNHHFLLIVTTSTGERNSSAYDWYIDTSPPTASIVTGRRFTNAVNITISIIFSEECAGQGGFKCSNASNCDVIVNGPGNVDPSTLEIVKHDIQYRLAIILSSERLQGRVVIKMTNAFCTDQAGNLFTRTKYSVLIVHFDRRPVHADFWSSIPSYELVIGKVPRTVQATNRTDELRFFLDFSSPIVNSTEDILNVLNTNSGFFVPIPTRNHQDHKFSFELRNVSMTEIVTVNLQSASLIGQSGNAVSTVRPIVILIDCTRPRVVLSTGSRGVTQEPNFNVIVEFTKPVFGFDASKINIGGGRVASFKELSKALYSVTILALSQSLVSVHVPQSKVNDIAGNQNLASNQLEVSHYPTPAISMALHSFVTAGLLATSLTASVLALSSANLAATTGIHSSVANFIISDPSRNLLGMAGHLQIFVLSDWFSIGLPVEYSETMKGLRWLIPHEKLPWKKESVPIWPRNPSTYEGSNNYLVTRRRSELPPEGAHVSVDVNSNYTSLQIHQQIPSIIESKILESMSKCTSPFATTSLFQTKIDSAFGMFSKPQNRCKNAAPLTSQEYFVYFLRGEPFSAANVVESMENYTGWQDLEMNFFWLGVGGGSLLVMHLLTLLFLRWRTGTSVDGLLAVPRFELFLLILMLPCIGQASAFVIRGNTTGGIISGVLLLAIPILLSIFLLLTIPIYMGSFIQYKEFNSRDGNDSWGTELSNFFLGRSTLGKWFLCEEMPSSFLQRFGILFEDRKAPRMFISAERNDSSNLPKWTKSDQTGIGRMRAIHSDDSNEDTIIPLSERFLGCARSAYIILDLLRRVGLGIISGIYSFPRQSQCILAFSITLLQFLYLFILKPYIRRGVHIVESLSLLCEAGIFALLFYINQSKIFTDQKNIGIVMLGLLFISFVSQLVNEWYALINCLVILPQSQNPSFKLGLKWVAKGLVLPLLPRKYWSKLVPGLSQPKTGLVPLVPLSPELELGTRDIRSSHSETSSQITATVVPVYSPDLPSLTDVGVSSTIHTALRTTTIRSSPATRQVSDQSSRIRKEEKHPKGLKLETKNDMKRLRELAKASFSGRNQRSEEGSSSYAPAKQYRPDESSSYASAASSPEDEQ